VTAPSEFPDPTVLVEAEEPVVEITLITPDSTLGTMLKLCHDRRGIQKEMTYIDSSRVMLKFIMPLAEIITDFHDKIKSISSGYARLNVSF
jgi:GTP-binding protein LepA